MKKLVCALLIVSAALLLLPIAGQVFAALGDSPANAVTLDCGLPATVPPGASYWLKITNTAGYQMNLALAQPPGGGLAFEVYTPDQAAKYGTDQMMLPTGLGTLFRGVPGADLNWAGHLPNGGVYYILVKNTSQLPATLNFTSCVTGLQTQIIILPPPPCADGLMRDVLGNCVVPPPPPPPPPHFDVS